MVDMFVFWLSYGILSLILWFGLFWLAVGAIDSYLTRITGGDFSNVIESKIITPILDKVKINDVMLSCTLWVGLLLNMYVQVTHLFWEDEKSLHEVTVWLSEFLVEYATSPILIVIGAILLDTTFRKTYKFGKKVLPLVDKINKEEK